MLHTYHQNRDVREREGSGVVSTDRLLDHLLLQHQGGGHLGAIRFPPQTIHHGRTTLCTPP